MDLTRPIWRKSSYSSGNGGNCVEIADNLPGVVAVRDSKNPDGPVLTLTSAQWRSFAAGVKLGKFPSPSPTGGFGGQGYRSVGRTVNTPPCSGLTARKCR